MTSEPPDDLIRAARDVEAFKLALTLLSPEGLSPGLKLLRKAYQAICDRNTCAEREIDMLRAEVARLNLEKKAAAAKAAENNG